MEEEDFEATLKNEFLMEAMELANECEDAFIELEKNPENSEIIDEIFRIAHTFKGGALTVGFDALGHFSHTFENVLMNIREHKLKPTSEVVDVLLEGNDILGKFIHALRDDFNAEIDTEEVSEKLKRCLEQRETEVVINDVNTALEEIRHYTAANNEDFSTNLINIDTNLFANLNVLICDDEEDAVLLMKSIISQLRVKIYTARNGEEALKVFNENRIDSIVTDLKMPKMNGLEFTREVRKLNKNVPVIFCSGFAERKDLVEFFELNTFGFIDKPFENHKILALVKNSLVMNTLKNGIATISQLNFNTYLLMSKILRSIESNDLAAIDPLKIQLESKMSEVSSCAEKILKMNKS